ncbi:hypothetical protein SAMN05216464_108183 [Mucilaginibacter pineti]|uniref:Uncharacterized protein n=1 Tax=Mucilaginibacter pineti TaxID=1391627 RepID=A0A1G7EWS2_9SPHI|nr:hypothetical protein SAMN05216464_108183 [Mucilaginibacter pineti]
MDILTYLIYSIPLIFILLSCRYMLMFKKLMGTGKVSYIIGAKQRQNLFLFLAIVSSILIFAVTEF